MVSHIRDRGGRHPDIVRVFSIGSSHEGRQLWAAEVSDQPGIDEGEPEVLFDGLHHAREHLSAEMAIDVLDLLTEPLRRGHAPGPARHAARRRAAHLDRLHGQPRRPGLRPDGLAVSLLAQEPPADAGLAAASARTSTATTATASAAAAPRRASPAPWNYRGPRAWSAPETRAMRDFVQSRVVDGRQRIRHAHHLPHRRRAGALAVRLHARATCRRT